MELGPHAAFIVLSYAAVAIVVAIVVAGLWIDGRRHAAELAALEMHGLDGRGDRDGGKSPS